LSKILSPDTLEKSDFANSDTLWFWVERQYEIYQQSRYQPGMGTSNVPPSYYHPRILNSSNNSVVFGESGNVNRNHRSHHHRQNQASPTTTATREVPMRPSYSTLQPSDERINVNTPQFYVNYGGVGINNDNHNHTNLNYNGRNYTDNGVMRRKAYYLSLYGTNYNKDN
jgi:hypothetical protein